MPEEEFSIALAAPRMPEEEFSIKCHATLNSRGETLDNDATPPPGLIAWHEARSNLRAPADAHTWTCLLYTSPSPRDS